MEYSAAFSVISSNMYTWHTFNEGCWPRNTPSKHAGSDQEAFWLLPVMASMQPESARIVYARSDFSHPFQFCFSKEGMDHIAQNRPGFNLDGLVRVWPNSSGLEASRYAGIIWPGFWQDATGLLLVSHFQTLFRSSTDVPDNIVSNQPGSDLVLADCVRFWPNANPIRHVYWAVCVH